MSVCASIGCEEDSIPDQSFCISCMSKQSKSPMISPEIDPYEIGVNVADITQIDPFMVHHLFDIQDPSGCIQHASRNLLLSYSKGGKGVTHKVREARDVLNRWLQINGH